MHESDANSELIDAAAAPIIAGYRIESRIGRGGMATVYLARQLSLDRPVAIKLMAPASSENLTHAARFEHEARIIARLEHPGIVGIHEVGRLDNGQLFYVMPHLPNGDLASRDLRHDQAAIIGILRVLLQALAHAHAHAIVHRDVKPENVLFDAAGSPRLADFGIAIGRRKATPRLTREGTALGSSGFMAPEQARGEDIDGRADLYSVGVLAYQMLTGRLPFEADDELTLALMHAQDEPPRLPPARRHWQPLLDKAMAKWPEQRYADAHAMLRGLEQVERAVTSIGGDRLSALRQAMNSRATLVAVVLLASLVLALLLVLDRPLIDPPQGETQAVALDPLAGMLAAAESRLAAGALVVPAGANAAEGFLDVLREQPGRADAMNGLRRVFAAMAEQAATAVASGQPNLLHERLQQAELLADGLGALGVEGRDVVRAAAQVGLDAEVDAAIAAGSAERVSRALELYALNGLDAANAQQRAKSALAPPVAAVAPSVTAAPGELAAASPRTAGRMAAPVSVADYARFATANGRPASRCRARLSPLQLLDNRSWKAPGFAQTDASPVVCISHADAEAYAAWLSQRSRTSWRLPTLQERSAAGAAGTVAEWTSDCATGSLRNCSRRVIFGDAPSGRPAAASGQARDGGRGFDDIGFRLVAK